MARTSVRSHPRSKPGGGTTMVGGHRREYEPAAEVVEAGNHVLAGGLMLGAAIVATASFAVQFLGAVLGLLTAIVAALTVGIAGTSRGRAAAKRTTAATRSRTAAVVQRRRQPASQVERWQRRDLRRERRHERNTRMWAALQRRRQQHRVVATERDMALSVAAQTGLARNRRRAAHAARRAREWLRNDPGERPTEMSQASLDLHEYDQADRKGEAA